MRKLFYSLLFLLGAISLQAQGLSGTPLSAVLSIVTTNTGTAGQVLATDAAGNLYWITAAGGSQTPWSSMINAAGFGLSNVAFVYATGPVTSTNFNGTATFTNLASTNIYGLLSAGATITTNSTSTNFNGTSTFTNSACSNMYGMFTSGGIIASNINGTNWVGLPPRITTSYKYNTTISSSSDYTPFGGSLTSLATSEQAAETVPMPAGTYSNLMVKLYANITTGTNITFTVMTNLVATAATVTINGLNAQQIYFASDNTHPFTITNGATMSIRTSGISASTNILVFYGATQEF